MEVPPEIDPQSPPPVEPSAGALPAKGLGPRALAFIIDGGAVVAADILSTLVSYPLAAALIWTVLHYTGHAFGFKEGNPWPTAIALAVTMPFFYFLLFEWLYGATPGKVLLDMRVVKADGRPCGLKAAAVRGLLRYVDGLLLGLGLWLLMRRPPHRRLGDRAAGTVVVDDRAPLPRRRPARRRLWTAAAVYFALCCLVNGAVFAATLRIE